MRRLVPLLLLVPLAGCSRDLDVPGDTSGFPDRIDDLRVQLQAGRVVATFTAPAVGGFKVAAYDLRFAPRSASDPGGFEGWTPVTLPAPLDPGTREELELDAALPPEGAVCFAIRALAGDGTAGRLSDVSCVDGAPPDPPRELVVAAEPEGRALRLGWTSPDAADLAGFVVLRAPLAPPSVPPPPGAVPAVGDSVDRAVVAAVLDASGLAFVDGGLVDGIAYGYAVHAYDRGMNSSAPVVGLGTPADRAPPPPALEFAAEAIGGGRILLRWTLGPDPDVAGVTLLRRPGEPPDEEPLQGLEYRAGDAVGMGTVAYDGTASLTTDGPLEAGATYHYALHVRDAAHNRSAASASSAVAVSGPPVLELAVSPGFAPLGSVVEVRFRLGATPAREPAVSVGEARALLGGQDGEAYRYTYRTSGAEPEGQGIPVVVSAEDSTGTSVARAQVVFDFTAPAAEVAAAPAALARGQSASIELRASEPVGGEPSVRLGGAPLACSPSEDRRTWSCPGPTAAGTEDESAPVSLEATFADLAGNPGSASGSLRYDFTPVFDPDRVALERRTPAGIAIAVHAGAVEPGAWLELFEDAPGSVLLGTTRADEAGLAAPVALAQEPAAVFARMTDAPGNRTGVVPVTAVELAADLELRPGDPASSPHRLARFTSDSIAASTADVAGAVALSASAIEAAAVADGVGARAEAAATGSGAWTLRASEPPSLLEPAVSSWIGGPGDHDRVVVFGGLLESGAESGEVWEYDGRRFVPVPAAGATPPARSGANLVFDEARGRLVLFGGEAAGRVLGDTWAYDPRARSWSELAPVPSAPPRSGSAAWYDPVADLVHLVGGRDANGGLLDELWTYDPLLDEWRQEATPRDGNGNAIPARAGGAAAYYRSPAGDQDVALVYGGEATGGLCTTWFYEYGYWFDGYSDWVPDPATCGPGVAMTSGWPSSPAIRLTGGTGLERYGFVGGSAGWFDWDNQMPPRRRHGLGVIASSSQVVSVGGEDDRSNRQPALVVERSCADWSCSFFESVRTIVPGARRSPSLVPLAGTSQVLLFGGSSALGTLTDAWLVSTDALENPQPSVVPPAYPGVLLPHPVRGAVLLQSLGAQASTWRFDAGAWQRVAGSQPPGGRLYPLAGVDSTGPFVSDGTSAWRFGAGWTESPVANPLPAGAWRGLAADPLDGLLAIAEVGGATAAWRDGGFEPIPAEPAAPDGAVPAADGDRVRAVGPGPSGLQVFEWAHGGWVPRSAPTPGPSLRAPSAARAPGGPGLLLVGDEEDSSIWTWEARAPIALPHLVATFTLGTPPAPPAAVEVEAALGGLGTAGDGGACSGASVFLQLAGSRTWIPVASTDAPPGAPVAVRGAVFGAEAEDAASGGRVRLLAVPRCAAEARPAAVVLDRVAVRVRLAPP